jgi:hypothetical protein
MDIAEVQTVKGKLYWFVAMDRTSKFSFIQLLPQARKMQAAGFLHNLQQTLPYAIHTVLTDNGIQFPSQEKNKYAFEHIFDRVCRESTLSID